MASPPTASPMPMTAESLAALALSAPARSTTQKLGEADYEDSAYSVSAPDAADEFAWADDDDFWVMGKMGMQQIAAMNKLMEEQAARPPPPPRQKTAAELAIEKSKAEVDLKAKANERRGACTFYETTDTGRQECNCKCKQYDPWLVLPYSLFSRSDLALDLEPAARRLVAEADLYSEGYWEEDTVKHHYYVYIEEYTPPPFQEQGIKTRIMHYRLRHDVALQDVTQVARLERLGCNLNDILLPKLAKWCDEYYASKRLHEKKAAQVKIEQGHTAAHMVSIRDKGEFLVKDTTWRNNAAISGDFSTEHQSKTKTVAKKVPIPHVDRPRFVCRCGHAAVWHKRADDLLDGRVPPAVRAANPIHAIDLGAGQRQTANVPRAVLQRPDVMLKTGKLVMNDSSGFSGMLD